MIATLKQRGLVDSDIFISQTNALTEQIRVAKQEKERLLNIEKDGSITETQEMIEMIESEPDFLTEFDEVLFEALVERIIIDSGDRVRFKLKNGLELREKITRSVR